MVPARRVEAGKGYQPADHSGKFHDLSSLTEVAPSPATLDNRGIAAGREGPPMPTSPPFSPSLKTAERNPQKDAADDVGAEDQHPDQ